VRVHRAHQLVEGRVADLVGIAGGVHLEEALLLGVGELVPARVALAEPEVAPFPDRDAAPIPLVSELVQHDRIPQTLRSLEPDVSKMDSVCVSSAKPRSTFTTSEP
jgi:hypothetical protein